MNLETIFAVILVVLIVGACLLSLLRRFTGKKSCCGTVAPKVKAKKLKAPIGSLTVRIAGMHCDNCRHTVMVKLNALDGVSAKVFLPEGTAQVCFERPVSDHEISEAIESAGFEVLQIQRNP